MSETTPNQEPLHDGMRQLAGNIVRIVETNEPAAVKKYLGDVLADTEQSVPAVERRAVLEFLAGEQRSEIHRSLADYGKNMLDNLGDNSTKARVQLAQTATAASRGMHEATKSHEQEVGRHIHGQLDTHRAARGQEEAEQAARRGFSAVTKYAGMFGAWSKAQQQEARQFDDKFHEGQAHERALTEAREAIKPDSDSEPKDLSSVIDEAVKESAAAKLQSAVAEAQAAGKSPEDAVLELMIQKPDSMTTEVIVELKTFAEQYASFAKTGKFKVEDTTMETERLIKTFVSRGRDGYQYVRRTEDAIDMYSQQQRTVERAAESADIAIRQSAKILGATDQELQRMRQKLVSVKTAQSLTY